MPKIEIPRITRPLDFAEYAPEMAGAVIHVWVNPSRKLLDEHDALIDEAEKLRGQMAEGKASEEEQARIAQRLVAIGHEIVAWHAEIWSQGPVELHWTADEIKELIQSSRETDPKLWEWLGGRTIALITEHRFARKKGSERPS